MYSSGVIKMPEIKKENAIKMHQSFFTGNFEIAPFEYCALLDVRPYSWFYPMFLKRILGNWTGFICTDGKKLVISKVSEHDIRSTWEINENELTGIKTGFFNKLRFTKKFTGLTNYSMFDSIMLWMCLIAPLPLYLFWYSRKNVICRIHDDYSNKFEIMEILKKQATSS